MPTTRIVKVSPALGAPYGVSPGYRADVQGHNPYAALGASMQNEQDPVSVDATGITLHPSYVITWDRLDSYPKLAAWIYHLSPKRWVTTRLIARLVRETERHFNWPHHHV